MTRKISAAQAKAQLSALMAKVAYGGEHVVIERRGKPIAALVSVEDLERLEEGKATSARPLGALALAGAWREVDDDVIETLLTDIYTARELDTGRSVEIED